MTEPRIYIVMRRDLNMPRGKEIAQACHAVLALRDAPVSMAIVGARAESEEHLLGVVAAALKAGVGAETVTDAGRTVFTEPTLTCAAIGPVKRGRVPELDALELY